MTSPKRQLIALLILVQTTSLAHARGCRNVEGWNNRTGCGHPSTEFETKTKYGERVLGSYSFNKIWSFDLKKGERYVFFITAQIRSDDRQFYADADLLYEDSKDGCLSAIDTQGFGPIMRTNTEVIRRSEVKYENKPHFAFTAPKTQKYYLRVMMLFGVEYDYTLWYKRVASYSTPSGSRAGPGGGTVAAIPPTPTPVPKTGNIYVDSRHSGTERGSTKYPFSSISRALEYSEGGARIIIQSGIYKEKVSIQKPLTIEAQGGRVIIGG